MDAIAPLVATALRFDETAVAEESLAQVREPDRNTAGYHQLMAALGIATGRLDLADTHFAEAAKLDPKNEAIQLNLASVRLQSTNPETVAEARATLDRLKTNPAFRLDAQRTLLAEARKRGDAAQALQIAKQIVGDPGCGLKDQLACLEEMQHGGDADFAAHLQALKNAATGHPPLIQKLIHWMNAHAMAAQALDWAKSQPREIQSQPGMQMMVAESLCGVSKWEEVRTLLARADWGGLEFFRYAILARAARETTRSAESKSKWERAVIATDGEVRPLYMLARLVNGWEWKTETEQVWWLIAEHDAGQRAALKSLYKLYSDARETPQLYRVAERVFQLDPNDPVAKNNMAALSLLLGKNDKTAHRLALENHRSYPRNAGVASTYAFSLYRQGKTGEALKVLEALPGESLKEPSIAAYYGVLLAADGDPGRARPFLEIASQSPALLPEEKALVDGAMKK